MKISKILTGLSIIASMMQSNANDTFSKIGILNSAIELQQSDTVKVTYKLKGFKQACCSSIVTYSLKEVKGYIQSEANVKDQEITVWYDKTKCKESDIKAAINKTAYKIIGE